MVKKPAIEQMEMAEQAEMGIGPQNCSIDDRIQCVENEANENTHDQQMSEREIREEESVVIYECDDDGEVQYPNNYCSRGVRRIQSSMHTFLDEYNRPLKIGLNVTLLVLYSVYFSCAMYNSFEKARALLAMTVFVVVCFIYVYIRDRFGHAVNAGICQPLSTFFDKHWNRVKWVTAIVILMLILVWIIIDTSKNPSNMMSFVGLVAILIFSFLFSKHPDKIRWRPVIWGLVLQVILALVILRTWWGFSAFRFLGEQMSAFVDYTEAGSRFVFGELWYHHAFAFKILPLVLFFGSIIAVLYHIGLIQIIIAKLAWLLQFTMHTSASESLATACAIFLSNSETQLMIGPYISVMSVSELHAVATAGYTTVSGSILGAGVSLGINASYMITASVMSAPAALAVSKIFYPEVEKSPSSTTSNTAKISLPKYSNVIDATVGGAMAAVPVAVYMGGTFLVVLALLDFMNAFLSWTGGMVGYPALSFEIICAWGFMPIAYLMGVDWEDCFVVGELIGMKIVTSVLVSYKKLAVILNNRKLGLEPTISPRSEVIVTYALSGFSHIAGIGMTMAAMIAIAPERSKDISAVVVRAMIAGNAANFLTASIAGILYEGEDMPAMVNSTVVSILDENSTAMYSTM
ncbi:solute carrier family 28 member 3-like [Ptychodera flava]|uniref:solute carrier family 28 member 3-like n=1 Tax=Ptychodera flava TaxID=63121 RepID=UPI00396A2F22